MSREQVFGSIRRALRREKVDGGLARELNGRLERHDPNLIPARTEDPDGWTDLFLAQVAAVGATADRVAGDLDVPAAVARYLADRNLEARVVLGPDPWLEGLAWDDTALAVRAGAARADDVTSVVPVLAGIAETGTVMLHSGDRHATTLNFLPENEVLVVRHSQIVGTLEQAWMRLRDAHDDGAGDGRFAMPRTVNLITGPSRTADIEQTLYMGAHGPKRLHILLIDEG